MTFMSQVANFCYTEQAPPRPCLLPSMAPSLPAHPSRPLQLQRPPPRAWLQHMLRSCRSRRRCARCGSGHRSVCHARTPRGRCCCTLLQRALCVIYSAPASSCTSRGGGRMRDTPACVVLNCRCSLGGWAPLRLGELARVVAQLGCDRGLHQHAP